MRNVNIESFKQSEYFAGDMGRVKGERLDINGDIGNLMAFLNRVMVLGYSFAGMASSKLKYVLRWSVVLPV